METKQVPPKTVVRLCNPKGGVLVSQARSGDKVRFGAFELAVRSGELWKQGVRLPIQGRPLQVLAILLERPGEMVSREELRQRLWPADTFVDFDHSVHNAVARLREVLGDSADTPRFIETLPRRGYRFIAPANWRHSGPGQGVPAAKKAPEEAKNRALLAVRGRTMLAASGVAVLAVAIALVVALRRPKPEFTRPQTIAVLPLQNASAAKDLDFLRIGLADDIATTLSHYPDLSVRPSTTSNRYGGPDIDLQKAALEMRVAHIVTGHFAVAGDSAEVTLEAVEAANNRVFWRTTLRGSARDLRALQEQIAGRIQSGLIAALGANASPGISSNTSHNAEAYELYLRAISQEDFTHQQTPFPSRNKEAIRLLERAVALDPGYASAWATLGHRYYYDIGFGEGGKPARMRAKAALRRALALDPGRIDAASDLVNVESEEGDLNQAYDDITRLLRQRPDSAAVHLVYSYVLWYGGLLDEAAGECEKTRSLDAGITDLASCGQVFMALGKYGRARGYFQLLSGTEYEKSGEVDILLREGKQNEGFQLLKTLPESYGWPVLEPCLGHGRTKKAGKAAEKWRTQWMAEDDPSPKYWLAAWDSLCGQPDLALNELRRAIEQNYCAYPQMETDPLLTRVRSMPEFAEVRSLGMACQQRFLEHRKQRNAE